MTFKKEVGEFSGVMADSIDWLVKNTEYSSKREILRSAIGLLRYWKEMTDGGYDVTFTKRGEPSQNVKIIF